MTILEKEVEIVLGSRNMKHYEKKGYIIPKYKAKKGGQAVRRGTRILVKVEDIYGGEVKLTTVCDECGKHTPSQQYNLIITRRKKNNGKDRCPECKRKDVAKKSSATRMSNVKYNNSLEHFAKTNDKEYLLSEFSTKNKSVPARISWGSEQKYWWNCPNCKSEYYMQVYSRTKQNSNCPYCAGVRVNRSNCLSTTHPDIANLLKNKEKGNLITSGSNRKELFKCPMCKCVEAKIVSNVSRRGYSCNYCSDKVSYPEKFVRSILTQVNIEYQPQKMFEWSKKIKCRNAKLNGNKIYDFYIPTLNCIIEVHGEQHYVHSFKGISQKSLSDEQENDKIKSELAKAHGIENYIVINCEKSDINWIKKSVLNSKLKKLINLSDVDWIKCHKYASDSLVKEVCGMWNQGLRSSIKIADALKLNRTTVLKYLKIGKELDLCQYTFKRNKPVVQMTLENGFIQKWTSMTEASKVTNVDSSGISLACRKQKTAGGYKWMYLEDYEEYIKNKSN